MGWGTYFEAEIYLNRQIFQSESEIKNEIEELTEDVQKSREALLILVASNYKDIREEDEDPVWGLRNRVQEVIDDITFNTLAIYRLRLYLEAIQEGKAKFETPEKTMGVEE